MSPTRVFAEIGKRKAFVGAADWPGWCRSGRSEGPALQTLVEYGSRYARVLQRSEIEFHSPSTTSELLVVDRQVGNATTDFGAPAIVFAADRERLDPGEFERWQAVLRACWQAFDLAAERATGRDLQKGPRGGGRDLDAIVSHLLEADRAYLARLAWNHTEQAGVLPFEELRRTRQAILERMATAMDEGLPERGPRGGIMWPLRYFIRRVAWHVLDHAWEIEDRIM